MELTAEQEQLLLDWREGRALVEARRLQAEAEAAAALAARLHAPPRARRPDPARLARDRNRRFSK